MSLLTAAVLTAAVFFFGSEQGAAGTTQGPARRFCVELQIVAGDARLLLEPGVPASRRHRLSARIKGSLSSLRILSRQYLEAMGKRSLTLPNEISRLDHLFAVGYLRRFASASARLAKRYPLPLDGLRPADARPADIAAGRHIYRSLCAACHGHPDHSRDNPAGDLFSMAHRLPEREFIARLLGGVHGTPAVALHNPFSDPEIAGLAAYLSAPAHARRH